MEPGAVVCRVSPSFVRFGTFQLPASRGGLQPDLVKIVADYVIRHHYPHLQGAASVLILMTQTSIFKAAGSREWGDATVCQDT